MEIVCRDKNLGTITCQYDKLFSEMIFEHSKIDYESLKEIIMLVIKYKDFYQKSLSYEKIMRQLRHLPNHLAFYAHIKSDKEIQILEGTMLDENCLPAFLNSDNIIK